MSSRSSPDRPGRAWHPEADRPFAFSWPTDGFGSTLGLPVGFAPGLPARLRIVSKLGDVFWAVEPDDSDVPWVVRFRIGRSDGMVDG